MTLLKLPKRRTFFLVDVAIGGTEVPGADGILSVWAITSNGRVVFRSGVSITSPEGLRWVIVKVPPGGEVSQISVGCTGLVWCSLYNGRAIVRTGVTRDNLMGENWIEVKPPEPGIKILCTSVGKNSVYCVTNDSHVWWRKGVKGELSGKNEDAAIGTNWIEMVGNISFISVTSTDQVFAIGSDDRTLYMRSGVTSSDPTGKKWRQIQCPMQLSRTSSVNSVASRRSGNESPSSKHKSLGNLLKEKSEIDVLQDLDETSYSAPNQNAKYKPELWKRPHQQNIHEIDKNEVASSAPSDNIFYSNFETRPRNPRSVSPIRSVGSVVACEVHPDSDSMIFEGESSRDSGIFAEDDADHIGSTWTIDSSAWTTITAGALLLDQNQLPNWFSNDNFGSTCTTEYIQSWRLNILESLKERVNSKDELYVSYEKAIELSSWVKSGEAKVSKAGKPYEDSLIELEWVDNANISGSGTLTILSPDSISVKFQLTLSDIMCVVCCSEPNAPRMMIFAPRLPAGSSQIKFQFSSESELEDWLSHLQSVSCQINNLTGKPAPDAVWATTNLGDVYACDSSTLLANQFDEKTKLYLQEKETSTESPYLFPLYNNMYVGSILEISGYVYPDADYIRFDLQSYPSVKNRQKERNIALHINPRFNENLIVFNCMDKSVWLEEVRDKNITFSPGSEFKLLIKSQHNGYQVSVDGHIFPTFSHRSEPTSVVSFYSSGRVKLFQIKYYSSSLILCPNELFWRQMGGHLKKIETCSAGITWGISYDNTLYAYSGGWGGAFLKNLETNTTGIYSMIDVQNYYVYENQRWNPISGFSSTGLPTDRHW